jgi:hypothetical protein
VGPHDRAVLDKPHHNKGGRVIVVEMNKTNGAWHGRYVGRTMYGPSQTIEIGMVVGMHDDTTLKIAWRGQAIERDYASPGVALMVARERVSIILGVQGKDVSFAFAKDPGSYAVDTSQEAAAAIKERAPKLRQRVYEYIHNQGARGATADEVQVALDLSHQTAAPRVTELAKLGRIVRTDERRKTRYGRNAGVYLSDAFNAEAEALAQDAREEEKRRGDDHQFCLIRFGDQDE